MPIPLHFKEHKMSYPTVSATTISGGVTAVDCQKQVRSWRLLRSLIELLIPTCNRTFNEENEFKEQKFIHKNHYNNIPKPKPILSNSHSNTITGTIFGHRRGKLSFCIQTNPKSAAPLLLLELAVPTTILAREMRGGLLRIVLECTIHSSPHWHGHGLLSTPVWTMYCNGRKVGFAVKRRVSKGDMEVLRVLDSVVVGAGIVNEKEIGHGNEIMYLRSSFERVKGSVDSETFHLIDPSGNVGQELSIFFLHSR